MSDHHAAASQGAKASNWLWALVAAGLTAAVGTWLTGMSLQGALLLAATVFAVVLAEFWEDPPHGDAHDHGHHGH